MIDCRGWDWRNWCPRNSQWLGRWETCRYGLEAWWWSESSRAIGEDRRELVEGVSGTVGDWGEGAGGGRMREGPGEVAGCCDGAVSG